MKWLHDDAGDIVNLDHIEYIGLAPIAEEAAEPDAPDGHTHQILAVNSSQESYRLFTGTEAECIAQRSMIEAFIGDVG